MKVSFSYHALMRIKERRFSKAVLEEIVKNPQETFYDVKNESHVASSVVELNGKRVRISVAYHYEGINVKIRTAHQENIGKIKNKVKSKRYIK